MESNADGLPEIWVMEFLLVNGWAGMRQGNGCAAAERNNVPEAARARSACCATALLVRQRKAHPTIKLQAVQGFFPVGFATAALVLGSEFWKLTRCGKRVVSECLKTLREV